VDEAADHHSLLMISGDVQMLPLLICLMPAGELQTRTSAPASNQTANK